MDFLASAIGLGDKSKAVEPAGGGGGTGYGGATGDTKKLVAGMKKAATAAKKDDKSSIRFLKQIQRQLKYQVKASKGGEVDLDDDDRKKLSALLADTFRNQVPTDWDQRKDLYNNALTVCRTLASNERLGTIFGDKEDQEKPLYWLLDFKEQAQTLLKRNDESGWMKQDEGDVLLGTEVSEVAEMALKISRRCIASKPVADLSVISLSERYQSQLGPLRFDSVDCMENVSRLERYLGCCSH